MKMMVLMLGCMVSADADSDAAAAIAIAQAQMPLQAPRVAAITYADALASAKRTGKPLVVFVGVPVRNIKGAITVAVASLPDGTTAAIIVSVDGQEGHWMPTTSSDAEIIQRLGVSQSAIPFVPLLSSVEPVRRDDKERPQLWPLTVEWFPELERYESAKNTQSLSRIGSFSYRDSNIAIVPRTHLKAKWQVAGGLEGIEGWRSDLYRFVPSRKQWIGMIAVFNGSNDQLEQGHLREYGEGTQFHDVLSHNGRIFEHRIAEKSAGKWERFVAYKDASARPPGYFGLRQSCVSCHEGREGPGTGGYGVGLVPGGDGIVSDPLDGVQ